MAESTLRSFARPTQASVASSATSVPLFAANLARKAILISNASTAILYILFVPAGATTAATATTVHSIQIPSLGSYAIEGYTGAATAIWASANGQANVTEFE